MKKKNRLCVNPLGEVFKGNDYLLGHASVKEVETAATKRNPMRWWDLALNALSELTEQEKALVRLTWRAQKINNSMVRVWTLGKDMRISTELRHEVADVAFWKEVKALAKDLHGKIEVMEEEVTNEHSYRTDSKGKKIPGSDKYGPHHGKLERQVELYVPLRDPTLPEIRRTFKMVQAKTEKLWKESGVSIN